MKKLLDAAPGPFQSKAGGNTVPTVNRNAKTTKVNFMKYNMQDFMKSCVDRYVELGGNRIKEKMRTVETPFLDESKSEFDENPDVKEDGTTIETKPGVLGDIACAVLMK